MRSRMRSNCPAGRAARSMPARSNWQNRSGTSMAKIDDTSPAKPPVKIASPARVAAFRTGLSAESRAAALLMAKGYRILAKRFRTPYGEIDLVAHPEHANFELRFDAMLIAPRRLPRHLLAAFDASP